jgi:hypothetical protein
VTPRPLFYKYFLGRDRYYAHVPGAQDTGQIEEVRQGIKLRFDAGQEVNFGWDIDISKQDYYGETLPQDVFSVVIFTEIIPSSTVWVEYNAVDRLDGYNQLQPYVRREVVNPVPMFEKKKSGRMTFRPIRNNDDSYGIEVTP